MTMAAIGPADPGFEVLRDVQFGTAGQGGRPLTMHVLRPSPPPAEPAPVLLWVHGGGWRQGSKDGGVERLAPFARRGYVCASVEYRLSREAAFPAQIEDVKCAVRFLRAHAVGYRIDPQRIGAWGSSAGGHLVALLGTAAEVPELEGNGGWNEQSSEVQAVCDWFGPTDFLQMDAAGSEGTPGERVIVHDAPDSAESQLIGGPIQEHPDRCARANPVTYVSGSEPPFLIVHGDADRTVPWRQSELLYGALLRAGAEVTFHTLKGAGHGGPAFQAPTVQHAVDEFFDTHLRPPVPAVARERAAESGDLRVDVVVKGSRLWVDPITDEPAGTRYRTFRSATIDQPVSYLVWLPPGYDAAPERRYPVIYWLHGLGGDQRGGAPFVEKLAQAVDDGIAPPAVCVLVNGLPASMYCDAAHGRAPVEQVVIRDLIPHVDATYRTIPLREARAIEGHSMGGFGAARLGFKYPDLFGAVSISAGALHTPETMSARRPELLRGGFGGDPAYFRAQSPWAILEEQADRIRGRTLVRILVGELDALRDANTRYHDLLSRLGIAHEFSIVPGVGHNRADVINARGVDVFRFYARAFAVAPSPAPVTTRMGA